MLETIVSRLTRPVTRWLLETVAHVDPWERFSITVPLHVYGLGATRDFSWYLQGESRVNVTSVEEVRDWLLDCEYVRDRELFRRNDLWQHPRLFERLRRGDCEDFCLWAWRKLIRLGYDTEFVAGYSVRTDGDLTGHAFLVYRDAGQVFLFDPVIRERKAMIRPLELAHREYLPEASVDGRLVRYAYGGYVLRRRGLARLPNSRSAS